MANKLLWSVSATAGIPADDTAAINSGTRTIPSTSEYSVCNRKWTNCLKGPAPAREGPARAREGRAAAREDRDQARAAPERTNAGARDRARADREAADD